MNRSLSSDAWTESQFWPVFECVTAISYKIRNFKFPQCTVSIRIAPPVGHQTIITHKNGWFTWQLYDVPYLTLIGKWKWKCMVHSDRLRINTLWSISKLSYHISQRGKQKLKIANTFHYSSQPKAISLLTHHSMNMHGGVMVQLRTLTLTQVRH
jgi:hypothetical protein